MPVHDWSRVNAGVFHDLHCSWIIMLKAALNGGLLPAGYYAQAEQLAGDIVPDVLTLQTATSARLAAGDFPEGAVAVAESSPNVSVTAQADEIDEYARLQKTLVIRHAAGDDVVALVEIVSKGNKQTRVTLNWFVDKAVGALFQGIHLLIADLQPPGRHDSNGIHGAIWGELQSTAYASPAGKPLTLAAYAASARPKAYVEPIAVGDRLPDMPLFIKEGVYVSVPLERTYLEAYATVPTRWRTVIEGRQD
jgi:hypothetical protein